MHEGAQTGVVGRLFADGAFAFASPLGGDGDQGVGVLEAVGVVLG